ncbi:alpha/beta hydrolase family protein [Rhizorhabdus argentea]|uniref:alpha/beta hydrolase family protein n=1 Tax=Rhizorhabdus argentea TaxID=1387174 RepID=UPI0030EF900A
MNANAKFDPNSLIDPTTCDPCVNDPEFPFEQFVTHFVSQGSVVHATVWISQGRELKGTVILSPQWFGGDRLESVIIPLMTAGINVMTFHPRGMWDNQHKYTLTGAVDDLRAAAEYVRSTCVGDIRTAKGHAWRSDASRIAVMGLSGGGGNVSLSACAEDPLIQSAIAVAANSMADSQNLELAAQMKVQLDAVKALTAGRVDVEGTMKAMTPAEIDRMRPTVQAHRLVEKNILLVGALRDSVAPLETCHKPIAQAMRDAGVRAFDEVILDSDHSFLTKRIALARLTIQWLRQRCGF